MLPLIVFDASDDSVTRIAHVLGQALRAPVLATEVVPPGELEEADLIVMGSPPYHRGAGPGFEQVFSAIGPGWLAGVRVATFDVRSERPGFLTRSGARRLAARARERGATVVVPPRSFFVEKGREELDAGQLEAAVEWAREIVRAIGIHVGSEAVAQEPPISAEATLHQYPEPVVSSTSLQPVSRVQRALRRNGKPRARARARV